MKAQVITLELHGFKQSTSKRTSEQIARGVALQPESVTETWYAAGCPQKFHPLLHGVSFRDWLAWKRACYLRGVR